MVLIKRIEIAIFQLTPSGVFSFLNPAWQKLTGFPIAATLGQSWTNFIHEQDHIAVMSAFHQLAESKIPASRQLECRLLTKDAHSVYVAVNISSITKDSIVEGFTGSFFNLTAYKQKLDASNHHQQRLSCALDGANDGYWDWDIDSHQVYYSPRWKTMLGYTENELPEPHLNTWRQLTNPNDVERVLNHTTDYFSGRLSKFHIEFQMMHKKGYWVDILSRASFARDHQGQLISPRRLIGTHVDITERKKTELQLAIQNIALESVANPMVITDPRSIVEWVNPAFLKLTGYTQAESVGKKIKGLVHSGLHNDSFYREMWLEISTNKVWQGDLINRKKDGTLYDVFITITPVTNEFGRILHYIAVKEDITQRKASEKEIRDLAFYDPLTKLPNRRLFLEQLKHAMLTSRRQQSHSALLFIDLDNFKTLNDTYGHNIGDMFLIKVSSQIRHCIRDKDIVARLGGDEFVVMLEQLAHDPQQAVTATSTIGKKILALLNQEYCFKEMRYRGSASIGICMFMSEYNRIEEILKRADTAMYEAKNAGRNTLRYFDPAMQKTLEQKIQLEKALWEALDKQEFKLHYQLQIDNTRNFTGIEALLRWQHPGKGILTPEEFLAATEQNGMIIPIGDWVIAEGFKQVQRWQRHPSLKSLTLSLNISAVQFQNEDFVAKLKAQITQHAIDCRKLFLELTESSLIQKHDSTIKKINELSAMGIRISIDNFGTGYSSLSFLMRLNLSQIKIDRMFVRNIRSDPNALILVKSIIEIGRNLALDLVAEGVENKLQFDTLKSIGCMKYQGHWISQPMSAEAIQTYVENFAKSRTFPDDVA
ncbi:MAG: EAL domain-containing protein [Nitrosomonas sp.]|nr:MAG: EAL domain-containing protein [Nitrosomonas sp.]